MKKGWKLVISILVPVLAGAVSGLVNPAGESAWYQSLNKPAWNPPPWLFGPVWTLLYVLMGIGFYLVWIHPASRRQKSGAYWFYWIQLALNFAWSFLFFTLHEPGWALVEMIVMWFFILLTMVAFSRFSKTASWLLLPYICWVSFATLLTWTIWSLNPGQ